MAPAGSGQQASTGDPLHLGGTSPLLLLIADADGEAVQPLAKELARQDIEVIWCADGAQALLKAGSRPPDVVLAAAELPVLGGADLARVLRGNFETPVLVGISGSDADETAAKALAAGAVACVPKPYRPEQLLPLLVATRNGGHGSSAIERGVLRLDPAAVTVHMRGRPVHLPLREFQLLHLLMSRPGTVLRREVIYRLIWGSESASTNTLAVHVKRLRARLGDNQDAPQIIQTVRGVGYRFINPTE